ncbi:MAG: anti-sigma factor [Dokdonella sp.]
MNTSSDSMTPERSDLAAEYVLGVLDAPLRRAATQRILREPSFAYEVLAWEARLMPLIDEVAPVPAPFALWPRIQAAAGMPNDARSRTTDVRATARPDDRAQARPSLWQSTPFWRGLATAAFATAVASLAILFLVPRMAPVPPPSAPMVAKLVQDDGRSLFLATVDARLGTVVVQPTTVTIPAGRVPELWLIPPGESPKSLGLLDPTKANAVTVPKNLIAALGPHAIFAVTVEPPGGGPGGKPSGPIIAKGEIALL